MRHRKAGKKLNRPASHRDAMFRNMAKAMIVHESIRTTEVRAKELRRVVEKLVTLAQKNDVPARRQAYKVLGNHTLVKRLFDEIGPRFAGVPGGYTRVVKLGQPRTGDCAPMAIIEFTRTAAGVEAPVKEEAPKAPAKEAAPEKAEEAPKKAPAKKAAPKKAAAKKEETVESTEE
ncbi:large subunit ribosomal protein L17 [Desulfobaculum xiamenense]|uniref:Large ribosomal subunit protein bL17 n=1 Tax=Desulfobaculum xiamenense TaxID=995050 RepID=A0A846QXW6_9BACT|nr:50S ribosomal protein L17 [Desulfobaculum xiamenense]NJB69469.1 large subunit ribosomal protein L17 [Desulfobaculum xiamenense]